MIFVEYGVAAEERKVVYSVWAQLQEQSVRALVLRDSVEIEQDDMMIQTIVSEINNSDEFMDTVEKFIAHFDR